MLYQMLTGVLPFRGDSMAELMYKIANEDAPDIRIVRSEISDQLAQVVARSLLKRSDLRYQDGDAFAADLRAVMAAMSGQAPAAEKPQTGPVMRPDNEVPAVPEKTTIMTAGGPGYDSAQKPETSAGEAFVRTAAFARPDEPGTPSAGDGKTDPDDTKTGHL